MSALSIPQLTPDNRLWRIDWFGEADYQPGRHSQPCIRVVTSPVLCDPNESKAILSITATDSRHQRQIWLPVGILYLVNIGDIWQDGQCVYTPVYQTEIFKKLDIRRDATNFIKAGLSIAGKFLLPLNEHPWHRLETHSYCLSVMLPNGKRIIIPCIELIRFYFGSSSRLLHLLFTELITEDLFWKHKHYDSFSGRLHLKLADGLSGMSATDIGRMALDPNAWRAARLIFHSCMSASAQREPVYPHAGFPFIGETDLVVSGKWLSNGATPDATFVVYSLKSCSHPFPFASLSYEVSDNQKVGAKKYSPTNQVQPNQQKTSLRNGSTTNSQKLTNTDPGTTLSNKEHWSNGNPRFPDLIQKSVWRERYDTNDPPAIIFLNSVVQDEQVSVGEGSSGNENTRCIDVGQGCVHTRLSEIDPKKYKFVYDGIEIVSTQPTLQSETVTAELITLPGYTHPVISLPHLVDENGEINSVSFCTDKHRSQRLRRGCFAEIKINDILFSRVLIVEMEDFQNWSVVAVRVNNFDLRSAIEKLMWEE